METKSGIQPDFNVSSVLGYDIYEESSNDILLLLDQSAHVLYFIASNNILMQVNLFLIQFRRLPRPSPEKQIKLRGLCTTEMKSVSQSVIQNVSQSHLKMFPEISMLFNESICCIDSGSSSSKLLVSVNVVKLPT